MNAKTMTALVLVSPGTATGKIVEEYRKSGGHLGDTAKALGASVSSMHKWIAALGIRELLATTLEQMISSGEYRPRKGGRPKGALNKKTIEKMKLAAGT